HSYMENGIMMSSWMDSARRYGISIGMALGLVLLAACGDEKNGGTAPVPPAAVATVSVAPGTASVLVGRQVTLLAVAKDADHRPLERAIAWASANAAIATVSATGTVTALAPGEVTITATSEGKVGSALIQVAQVPVAEVRLSADEEVVLEWNGSTQLSAVAMDAEGNTITGRAVAWQSSKPEVVTVAPDGTLQAQASGVANVTAIIEGKAATVGVRVNPVPVTKVSIDGHPDGIETGDTFFLSSYVEGANGQPQSRIATWTTDNAAIATVQASQQSLAAVQAVGAGTVTITASVDDKSASITFAITPRPTHDLLYTNISSNGAAELFLLGLAGGVTTPVRLNAGNVSREPSPSPDGQRIVFSVSQAHPVTGAPQNDLYIVQRNGMGMRQLTSSAGYEHQPMWSPDGSRILFRTASTASARPEIWVINPDGSGLTNLSTQVAPEMTDLRDAAWSPDGSQIAFIGAVNGQHKVWLMNADGTNPRQLTKDVGFDSDPTWSPDGSAIAFTRWNVANPAFGEDLMIVPLATGTPRRIALPGDQRSPAWSPDGRFIAYSGTVASGAGTSALYTIRPDGTGIRTRTAHVPGFGVFGPAWITR
ncbi:MAG: Ig-like domain-containing protein, partial [Gemmatimonadota bacterium]